MAQKPPSSTKNQEEDVLVDLIRQNQELEERLNESIERQKAIEAAFAQSKGSAKQMDDYTAPTIEEEKIQEFLKSTRPDTEFFSIPAHHGTGQFRKICLFPDYEEYNQATHRSRRGNALWLEFALWSGPGSDLIDGQTGRPERFGRADISELKMVTITEKDIGEMRLPEAISPRKGQFSLTQCIQRALDSPLFKKRRVVTGEIFRRMIRSRYEQLWSRLKSEQELEAEIQRIGEDQLKMGVVPVASIER
jgi:hypothetical protein